MSYNPNKESGADYFARTQKQEFEPQNIQQRPSSEMPVSFHGIAFESLGEFDKEFQPPQPFPPQPFEPDEYGVVPQMLPFEGTTFDDTPPPGLDETPIAETAVFENEPGKPSGSFTYGGVNYVQIKGKWTALKPDGTPMNPGEMFQHTNSMHQNKKPGHITGNPLLPSRLFEKPTVAQR